MFILSKYLIQPTRMLVVLQVRSGIITADQQTASPKAITET
jgi:hypothetical protein